MNITEERYLDNIQYAEQQSQIETLSLVNDFLVTKIITTIKSKFGDTHLIMITQDDLDLFFDGELPTII